MVSVPPRPWNFWKRFFVVLLRKIPHVQQRKRISFPKGGSSIHIWLITERYAIKNQAQNCLQLRHWRPRNALNTLNRCFLFGVLKIRPRCGNLGKGYKYPIVPPVLQNLTFLFTLWRTGTASHIWMSDPFSHFQSVLPPQLKLCHDFGCDKNKSIHNSHVSSTKILHFPTSPMNLPVLPSCPTVMNRETSDMKKGQVSVLNSLDSGNRKAKSDSEAFGVVNKETWIAIH